MLAHTCMCVFFFFEVPVQLSDCWGRRPKQQAHSLSLSLYILQQPICFHTNKQKQNKSTSMGLFKKRTGTLNATDESGRHFLWTIPKFTSFAAGATLDSENVACFNGAKFHFHMQVGTTGDIGLYIHYKKPPIPKYSYYFQNSKNEIMRQHTAHSIPENTERCGHWNVCTHRDMISFLGEENPTLRIYFAFDEDTLTVKRLPGENIISVLWTIPHVMSHNINPYSSRGYVVDYTLLVNRLDVKRRTPSPIAPWDVNDVTTVILFLFSRKGKIPPHSIELLTEAGEPYYTAPKKDDGTATTLMVDKDLVVANLGADGSLIVRVNLHTGGNPLEALAALSGLGGAAPAEGAAAAGGGQRTRWRWGERELYNVMDD
ncbi:hypothetical protein STCU_09032 [Strigomonas culicis]|uniref:Uncharacterized protein n=1 Tax=Strigomonas culicis TaxID=28005 RepID=S9TUX2_9TRYP|nr:hypothetical protein STCU_09032 [Strigomonas culicis]|eukprot:EPY20358.1 hypothetical protein STCU_09032 [Strigomonas culicis]